mgnify:CR=1 FL=1
MTELVQAHATLACIWCDEPIGGPIVYRLCASCAPLGDVTYACTAGRGHLPTFSSATCASCDEDVARAARVRAQVAPRIAELREMRADHVRDFRKPWPGMDFAKALFGQMVDGAISDLQAQIDSTSPRKRP